MLQKCAALTSGRALVDVQRQPTSGLIPLVLMVRANIPQFKAAVEAVVAQAFPAAANPTSAVPTFASLGFGAPPGLFGAAVPAAAGFGAVAPAAGGGLFGAAPAVSAAGSLFAGGGEPPAAGGLFGFAAPAIDFGGFFGAAVAATPKEDSHAAVEAAAVDADADVIVADTVAVVPGTAKRGRIPQFKAAVEAVVAQTFPTAAISTSPASKANVSFRPETKAPYRVIEKALTKGPNRNYPDCSNVLDVFGCLIECADYVEMAAVVQAFADKHNAGEIDVTRVKDRWTTPSGGGWRDLMLNVAINGVVFEVQVVLHAMLVARKALDAHKAYNQFRSFAEVFNLLDLSPESETHMHGADNDGGDSGVAQHGSEVEELKRKLAASEEARAAAEGALAASAVRIVELEAEIERLTRSSSIPV